MRQFPIVALIFPSAQLKNGRPDLMVWTQPGEMEWFAGGK